MKLLFAFVLVLLPLMANAGYYDVQINGIYYKLNNDTKEATVAMGCTEEGPNSHGYGPLSVVSYSGDVVIPESFTYNGISYTVTSIEGQVAERNSISSYGAFEGCKDLTSITIPKTIKVIGSQAFSECTSLQAVYISDLTAWCNISFNLYDWWGSYVSGANPLYFAHDLYLNGNKISNLTIPEEVSCIKDETFIGSSISSVVFHKKVSEIGYHAFRSCNSLKDVYSYSKNLTTNESFNEHANKTLHIRERYYESYFPDDFLEQDLKRDWKFFGKVEYIEGVDYNLVYVVDDAEYKNIIMEVGEKITPEPEPTKEGYTFSGWSEIPDIMPPHDVTVTGSFIPNESKEQCSTPSIAFVEGKLIFDCETEDAEFHYDIQVEDAKEGIGSEVVLSSAYEITVYASKEGYNDSEKNTATLYWVYVDPITTGVIDSEMRVNTNAVLVQNTGGVIILSGVSDDSEVVIYSLSGQMIAHAKASGNRVDISTNLASGDICIIKIGDRSVKYILR